MESKTYLIKSTYSQQTQDYTHMYLMSKIFEHRFRTMLP
jgi:hypothetical protein